MSVDQQIKQHLRSRMAAEASDAAPLVNNTARQGVVLPLVQPPPARSAMRSVSNLLIVVGVLILGYVVTNQGYTFWQEQTVPRVQQLAGVPTTTYLSGSLLDTPTPTGVSASVATTTPQAAAPTTEVGQLPQISKVEAVPPLPAPSIPASRVRRITAPAIKLDVPVIDVGWKPITDQQTGQKVAVWDVAEYAAGHHQGSANPGAVGNIVVSGHNDWKGEVFRYLEKLELGAEISLYNEQGVEFRYLVTQIERVKEANVPLEQRIRNAGYMNPTPDQTLTLITCWPYKVDTYRLIVIAKPYNVVKAADSKPAEPIVGPILR